MRYRVTIEGETREIDVAIEPDGSVRAVLVDGAPLEVEAIQVPGGVSLRVGGRVLDVAIGGPPEARTLAAGPRRAIAEVESERSRSRKARRRDGAGGKEVRSPMPGRIVKVLVAKGDQVAVGAPVIVVEAMKMENELRAPSAGRIRDVSVVEGQLVDGNALLIVLE